MYSQTDHTIRMIIVAKNAKNAPNYNEYVDMAIVVIFGNTFIIFWDPKRGRDSRPPFWELLH
jgi:hypothetical protein